MKAQVTAVALLTVMALAAPLSSAGPIADMIGCEGSECDTVIATVASAEDLAEELGISADRIADQFGEEDINICFDGSNVAVPVTAVIAGNGGDDTWFQLFRGSEKVQDEDGAHRYQYYASWSLSTNSAIGGADDWAFGVELSPTTTIHGEERSSSYGVSDHRGATCARMALAGASTDYFVDAGSLSFSGTGHCSFTLSWEVTAGVKVGATGPSGYGEVTLGGSVTCGASVTLDSESLLRDSGTTLALPAQ